MRCTKACFDTVASAWKQYLQKLSEISFYMLYKGLFCHYGFLLEPVPTIA